MRISYLNGLDDLTSTAFTVLGSATGYSITNTLDPRLGTTWRSTLVTDQTIVINMGGGERATFQAITNVLSDPSDFTQATWTKQNCTASSTTSINGYQGNLVTKMVASSTSAVVRQQGYIATGTTQSMLGTVRYSSDLAPIMGLSNASTGTAIATATIYFSSKSVILTAGTKTVERWIDDYTVELGIYGTGVTIGNEVRPYMLFSSNVGTGGTVIGSAFQLTQSTYPLDYVATSASAWSTTYAHRLPPSGQFIVDCEICPFFKYDTVGTPIPWSWYIGASNFLELRYVSGTGWRLAWRDGGGLTTLDQATAFDGGTALTINQNIRVVASVNLTTGTASGSRLFVIPRKQGSLQEATAWSTTADVLASSTFTTLSVGTRGSNYADSMFKSFRLYSGLLTETVSAESDIDDELIDKVLEYSQDYQSRVDFDTVAIMGHNISGEAAVKVEANDWNEWNYNGGTNTSIIQQTLTWDTGPILNFLSSRYRRQYLKFAINDPNNTNGYIEIGRLWAGKYITISPESLIDFKVTKKNSDTVVYGKDRQKFSVPGVSWRRFELSFPTTHYDMIHKIEQMVDQVGNHSSIIFCNFNDLRDYELVNPVYCSIDGDQSFSGKKNLWFSYDLRLEEDK